jgi:hypothetical protein
MRLANLPPRKRMQKGQDGLQHGSGHCLSLSDNNNVKLRFRFIKMKVREPSKLPGAVTLLPHIVFC